MILFTYIIASLSEKSLQCRTSSKFEHVAFALLSSATKLLFAHTSNLFSIFFSSTDSGKARPECVDRDEASYSKYAHTCVEQGTLGLTAARQNSTPQYNRETASSTAMTRPTAGNTTPPRFTRKRQQKPANKRYLKKPSHFKAIDTSWHYMHHFYTRMKRPYDKSHIPGIVNTPQGFYGTTSKIVGCLQFFLAVQFMEKPTSVFSDHGTSQKHWWPHVPQLLQGRSQGKCATETAFTATYDQ